MFNKIVIVGRLGFPPSLKQTKSATQMCNFTVAVSAGYGDNKSTDWYNVTVFGKLAEICSTKLQKGSLVCVSGSLKLREYESKDGQKKASLDVTSDSVIFLDHKPQQNESVEPSNQAQPVQSFDEGSPQYIPF